LEQSDEDDGREPARKVGRFRAVWLAAENESKIHPVKMTSTYFCFKDWRKSFSKTYLSMVKKTVK
jgi:hypothetical protein